MLAAVQAHVARLAPPATTLFERELGAKTLFFSFSTADNAAWTIFPFPPRMATRQLKSP